MSFRPRRSLDWLTSFAFLAALTVPLTGQQGAGNGEWRVYHGDAGSTRYSPLDQIRPDNLEDLQIAWRFKMDNFGTPIEFKNETTPLYINGVVYFTAGYSRDVVAVDAGTGRLKWVWSLEEGERGLKAPRRNSGRGVSYWKTAQGEERLFVVTPGYQLAAIDVKTGLTVPNFGVDGVIDLRRSMGRDADDPMAAIGSSSPPVISHGTIVLGPALEVGGRPRSKANVAGFVRAFDALTGKPKWTFRSIPQAGDPGVETWENESWKYTGNVGAWAPLTVDEELGYLYLPLEAPTGDYYGGPRLGANLYSSSLACVEIATGKLVWHYQLVHHDIFDYDNPAAPILANLNIEGKPVKTVVQITKMGWAVVFDRVTGKPIWPIEERPVPASDVPGETAWPTQPFPTKPAPFDRQGFQEQDIIDFTPEIRTEAMRIAKQYRIGPLYTPPSVIDAADGTKGTLILPSSTGGANWEGGAFDPETGFLYVGSQTWPSLIALQKPPSGDPPYVTAPGNVTGPWGLPIVKPPYGRITALNLNTGDLAWQKPNGGTPHEIKNHPKLRGVTVPPTGTRARAGLLLTKSVLFAGEGWGGLPWFRAYDKKTGAILWETELPGVQSGVPMTYMHNDQQYVVFSIGDQERNRAAEIIAFRLVERPKSAATPTSGPAPTSSLTEAERAAGWTSLFDGQTLRGWMPLGRAEWTVADGAVSATTKEGVSYLRSTREWSNVEVSLEFLADSSVNSGVFLRCPTVDAVPVSPRSCYEVNIMDAHEVYPTGSVTDVARVEGTPATAGTWTRLEITADGPSMVVKLNGKEVTRARDDRLSRGAIALQITGQGQIKFRNIKVRKL